MATIPAAIPAPSRSRSLASFWRPIRSLLRKPTGAIGLIGTLFFLFVGFFGPYLVPQPQTDINHVREAPSALHPLGTENNGKDVLILIIRGGQDVLIVALLAGALTTVIAVGLGALAAYLGGLIDRAANAVANLLLTVPTFVLLSVLSTVIRLDNSLLLALLIAALSWPSLMRTVRAQVLTLREREYIEAAVALDLGTPHIIVQEILPNMASYILINAIFVVTSAVYFMIALIFLGFVSISVKTPNWGVIINTASSAGAITNSDTVWWILAPVLTIALLQWFLITLARSIEDVFNPRLKSGG
ncbi:MAG: ABC transporter permease [Aggregatilineales bacterium]